MENKTNEGFLSKGYAIPETSNYFKFKEGENTFRVLSPAITGYEYWNNSNKPIRSKVPFESTPDIKTDKEGKSKISHFWAFVVWNYQAKRVQILEITQKSIQEYILGLSQNKKWGNPTGYDINVKRSGTGLETEYVTTAEPHTPVDPEVKAQYEKTKINLEALYSGSDPFNSTKATVEYPEGEINAEEIPF